MVYAPGHLMIASVPGVSYEGIVCLERIHAHTNEFCYLLRVSFWGVLLERP